MLIESYEFAFDILADHQFLDERIKGFLREQNIDFELEVDSEGTISYQLFSNLDELPYCHLTLSTSKEDKEVFSVSRYFMTGDDPKKDQRLNLLRRTVTNLFVKVKLPQGQIPNLSEGLRWLHRPITLNELAHKWENLPLMETRKSGIYSRKIVEGIFKGSQRYIQSIINNYKYERKKDISSIWGMIYEQIYPSREGEFLNEYYLFDATFEGLLGKIEMTSISDEETLLRIMNASRPVIMTDQEAANDLYFSTLSELEILASYLVKVIPYKQVLSSSVPEIQKLIDIPTRNKNIPAELPKKIKGVIDITSPDNDTPSKTPKEITPEMVEIIKQWVSRDVVSEFKNMDEFLELTNTEKGIFITKKQFKVILRHAGELGYLKKGNNGKWIPAK